jgi:3-oxoacyl-[acyl-carrier-protein] synthase II
VPLSGHVTGVDAVTRRVVVTGVGAVTPLGIGADVFWRELLAGHSGIRPITGFDASDLEVKIAGEVPGFVARDHMDPKLSKRMAKFAQFAVAATREALDQAGLEITDENRAEIGITLNTGGGGVPLIEDETRNALNKGRRHVGPFLIPLFAPNMASSMVGINFGIKGPTTTSVAACAAGTQAFVDAVYALERGDLDVMITGGTEAALSSVAITSLAHMGALSRWDGDPAEASRPFDAERNGFVFSEGAAVMVLESEEHALARGATPIAIASGGAYTADAFHLTAPDPSGESASRAMKRAIQRAGLQPTDIDYVAAHATATPLGDVAETVALKKAFGDHAASLAISANKSMVGHLLGAAGAISSLACVLAIRDGMIPPTINLHTPDPACDLDYTPNVMRELPVRAALANGFGFGGQNACAVFRRYES